MDRPDIAIIRLYTSSRNLRMDRNTQEVSPELNLQIQTWLIQHGIEQYIEDIHITITSRCHLYDRDHITIVMNDGSRLRINLASCGGHHLPGQIVQKSMQRPGGLAGRAWDELTNSNALITQLISLITHNGEIQEKIAWNHGGKKTKKTKAKKTKAKKTKAKKTKAKKTKAKKTKAKKNF